MLKVVFVLNIKIACFKVSVKFQIFSFEMLIILMQCEVLHLYVFLLLCFMCVNCKLAHKTKFFKKINIEIFRLCLPDYIVIRAIKLNNLKSLNF